MLSWVDGKKVFFLPPDRGQSAGRRRAIEMRCGLRTATPSTLVLPALQEHQLQATSAQTRKTCVCAAAACFLVLLLPLSCSRPCRAFFKKKEMLRSTSVHSNHFDAAHWRVLGAGCLPRAPYNRVSLYQYSVAALNASGSKDLHRGPYQQA
jgi:hypothetical protein